MIRRILAGIISFVAGVATLELVTVVRAWHRLAEIRPRSGVPPLRPSPPRTFALFHEIYWDHLGYYSLLGIAVAVVVYGLLWRGGTKPQYTRCRKCGYILHGLSEPRCPECGEPI
jgi:hypothetical protein